MEAARIVLMAVVAAVAYGIAHDLITTRVSIEYFTIGHPRLIESTSPVVLAFFWGTIATWWVGLPMGALLAAAARVGGRPRLAWRQLVRPLVVLLAAVGGFAVVGGFVGYGLSNAGRIRVSPFLARQIPNDRSDAFLAAGAAHTASYAAAVIGGVALCILTWRRRSVPSPN